MKHAIFILTFLIGAYILPLNNENCYKPRDIKKINPQDDFRCGVFSNKRTYDVDWVLRAINLRCDSTYFFQNRACLCSNGSEGSWSVSNGIIYLKSSAETLDKIKKENERAKKRKYPCKHMWLDFTGTSIIYSDSMIIWKLPGCQNDTLYRD